MIKQYIHRAGLKPIVLTMVIIQLSVNVFAFSQLSGNYLAPKYSVELSAEMLQNVEEGESNTTDELPTNLLTTANNVLENITDNFQITNPVYDCEVDISTPPPQHNS